MKERKKTHSSDTLNKLCLMRYFEFQVCDICHILYPPGYNFAVVMCGCCCDGSIRCCMRCPSGTDPICVIKKNSLVSFRNEFTNRERDVILQERNTKKMKKIKRTKLFVFYVTERIPSF